MSPFLAPVSESFAYFLFWQLCGLSAPLSLLFYFSQGQTATKVTLSTFLRLLQVEASAAQLSALGRVDSLRLPNYRHITDEPAILRSSGVVTVQVVALCEAKMIICL